MLNFVKCFLCIYGDHMAFAFFFFFVNVVYHTDFSAYVEASLQPSNESNLIMVYDSFYVLLDLVC